MSAGFWFAVMSDLLICGGGGLMCWLVATGRMRMREDIMNDPLLRRKWRKRMVVSAIMLWVVCALFIIIEFSLE